MKKLEEELTKEANSNFEVSSPHLKKWSKKSISEEEKKKFREIFQKADINNEGTLNVEFGMKLFSRSKLTSVELTKIW